MNCHYNWKSDLSLLSFSLDDSTNTISMTVSNLFNDTDELYPTSITIGNADCLIDTTFKAVSQDGLTVDFNCKYDHSLTQAGTWYPQIAKKDYG